MPHVDNITIWHLRDLASGARKRILGKDVLYLNVPHYEGLTIKLILEFGKTYADVVNCFPEKYSETEKLGRSCICNVIYTLVK